MKDVNEEKHCINSCNISYVCFKHQIAQPVAATKLVDHGSVKGTDPTMRYYKYTG